MFRVEFDCFMSSMKLVKKKKKTEKKPLTCLKYFDIIFGSLLPFNATLCFCNIVCYAMFVTCYLINNKNKLKKVIIKKNALIV